MVRNCGELGINLQKIMKRLLANQNLLKYLYYSDKDPLSQADLTDEVIRQQVTEKLIKVVPRVGPKETAQSLIALRVVRGMRNKENLEFQDLILQIEVFTPMTQWIIKDTNLRPFAIIGELQNSLDDKIINGLGRLMGGDFDLNFLTEEMSCYEVTYRITDYE